MRITILFCLAVVLSACTGNDGGSRLKVNNPNELADALAGKIRLNGQVASVVDGDVPAASADDALRPEVQNLQSSQVIRAGQPVNEPFDVDLKSDQSVLQALFAKVVGSDTYFQVEASTTRQKSIVATSLSFTVPADAVPGGFCLDVAARANDRVSPLARTCFSVRAADDTTVTPTPTAAPTPTVSPSPTAMASPTPVATPSAAPVVDTDVDGVPDSQDNCPNVANADQLDTDQNGVGDACEGNNVRPVAVVGEPRRVFEGDTVILDGSASSDAEDGFSLSFQWTGPVTLQGANTAKPSFVAPNVDVFEDLVFTLVVTDSNGGKSAPATVRIEVSDPVPSQPFIWPVAGVNARDYTVTSYIDLNDTPDVATDYTGGGRAFDGLCRYGIDARAATYRQRDAGIDIYPLAAGEVIGVYDEIPEAPEPADCAPGAPFNNSILIRHAGGYVTSYRSIRAGSAKVVLGDRVTTDTVIAQMGSNRCEGENKGDPALVAGITQLPKPYDPNVPFSSDCADYIDPFALSLFAGSQSRPAPPYDTPATIMDVVLEADGIDDDDQATESRDDAQDAPAVNDPQADFGGVMGIATWIGGGLPGETLAYRISPPAGPAQDVVLTTDLAANANSSAQGPGQPFSPQFWYHNVTINQVGVWQVEIILNGQVAETYTWSVSFI